jgi:betaine-homocysteine S-methyltransferase
VIITLEAMAFQEMADDQGIVKAAQDLEGGGADVVGLNYARCRPP